MEVYLLAVVWDRLKTKTKTKTRCSGSGPAVSAL